MPPCNRAGLDICAVGIRQESAQNFMWHVVAAAAAAAVLGHNGEPHPAGKSSSLLVGPTDAANTILAVNYGMNTIRRVDWDSKTVTAVMHPNDAFPLAAIETTWPDTVRRVLVTADTADGMKYFVDGSVIAAAGCPTPFATKMTLTHLVDLMSATVYELGFIAGPDITCTQVSQMANPISTMWGGEFGGGLSIASWLSHNGCEYWLGMCDTGGVCVQSTCLQQQTTVLSDCGGFAQHIGGELFVVADRVYVANGNGNMDGYDSCSQSDSHLGGKILEIAASGGVTVVASGLRHPWTAVTSGDTVFIADVGGNGVEEITAVDAGDLAGSNFGWPISEGDRGFSAVPRYSSKFHHHRLPGYTEDHFAVCWGPRPRSTCVMVWHWVLISLAFIAFASYGIYRQPAPERIAAVIGVVAVVVAAFPVWAVSTTPRRVVASPEGTIHTFVGDFDIAISTKTAYWVILVAASMAGWLQGRHPIKRIAYLTLSGLAVYYMIRVSPLAWRITAVPIIVAATGVIAALVVGIPVGGETHVYAHLKQRFL